MAPEPGPTLWLTGALPTDLGDDLLATARAVAKTLFAD
jgi:hypothetical protein